VQAGQLVSSFRNVSIPSLSLSSRRINKNSVPTRNSGDGLPSKAKKTGNRVLIVGLLRELALYRAEVLRQSGFVVYTPADIEEAVQVMQRGEFDALVLSYTLPNEVVQYLAELGREIRPDCPIVAIRSTATGDRRVQPDAIALADEGPASLLKALQSVLEFRN